MGAIYSYTIIEFDSDCHAERSEASHYDFNLGAYCLNINKKIVVIANFFRIITSLLHLL